MGPSRIATHEAAHAVVAASLHLNHEKHSIVLRNDGSWGLEMLNSPAGRFWTLNNEGKIPALSAPDRSCWVDLLEKECMVTLAGGLAQNMFLGYPLAQGSEQDLRVVDDILGWLAILGSTLTRAKIEKKTKKQIMRHKLTIETLALVLDSKFDSKKLPMGHEELLEFYQEHGVI
jgi:hypothetical protein